MIRQVTATAISGYDKTESGQVSGVAQALDGAIWVEIAQRDSSKHSMVAVVTEKAGVWHVRHKCGMDTARVCPHVKEAIAIAHKATGRPFLTAGYYDVDVTDTGLELPATLVDATASVLGRGYTGSRLAPAIVTSSSTGVATSAAAGPASSSMTPPAVPIPSPAPAGHTPVGIPADPSRSVPSAPATPGVAIPFSPLSETELRRAWMVKEGVPAGLIAKVLSMYRPLVDVPAEFRHRIPSEPILTGVPDETVLMIAALVNWMTLWLVGGKGSGKSIGLLTLAWLLGLPVWDVTGNIQTDVAELSGDRTLGVDPISGQNVLEFQLGKLTMAAKHGGMGVVDEATNLRPEVLTWIHPLLDTRRSVDVPHFGVVEAHPKFRCAFSANQGYAGCVTPNEATVDRCVIIRMPYITDLKPLLARTSLKEKLMLTKLAELYEGIRKMVMDSHEITTAAPLTPRGILDAANLIADGISPRVALYATVLNKIWDHSEDESAVNAVRNAINNKFPK